MGLDTDCDLNDVKAAYNKLVKEYHPDVAIQPDADEVYRHIIEAYEYLYSLKSSHVPVSIDIPLDMKTDSLMINTLSKVNDNDPDIARQAIKDLGSNEFYNDQKVIGLLIRLLGQENIMFRRNAVIALGNIRNPSEAKHICRLLDDEWEQIRFDAVKAMMALLNRNCLKDLESMALPEKNNSARVIKMGKEAIYRIKKANMLFNPSRKCPYCSGYDDQNNITPCICHECYNNFWPPEDKEKFLHKFDIRCDHCKKEHLIIMKCEHCGGRFCEKHISPEKHQCRKYVEPGLRPIGEIIDRKNQEKVSSTGRSWILVVSILAIFMVILITIVIILSNMGFAMTESNETQYYGTMALPKMSTDIYNNVLYDKVITINDNYYYVISIDFEDEKTVKTVDGEIGIKTDGLPVDVFILDTDTYDKISMSIKNNESYDIYSIDDNSLSYICLNQTEYRDSFIIIKGKTFYLLIDNTCFPVGGAYADKDVNVHFKIIY